YTIDPLILGVSRQTWDSFSAKDKEIVAKAAQEAMAWNKAEARKGLAGSTEAIDMLKSKGMEVVVLSPQDMAAFKAKTQPVYDKWIKEIGADLVSAAEKAVKAVSR
ncbi:MAG: C4-dicarboxylate ABC transporter, partial [Planctomycetaceae bacterium]